MTPASAARLEQLERAGGQVIRVANAAEIAERLAAVPKTVDMQPAGPEVRALLRRWDGGGLAMLFNEGGAAYRGLAAIDLPGTVAELVPGTGELHAVQGTKPASKQVRARVPVELAPGESLVLVFGVEEHELKPSTRRAAAESLAWDDGWQARKVVEHRVGAHDFEVVPIDSAPFTDIKLGAWSVAIDADFSGRVAYLRKFVLGDAWRGRPLRLKLGASISRPACGSTVT